MLQIKEAEIDKNKQPIFLIFEAAYQNPHVTKLQNTPETWDSWDTGRSRAPKVAHGWRITVLGWIWHERTTG